LSPYAETKEQIDGILLLDASDLNHAIGLMSKHAGIRLAAFAALANGGRVQMSLAKTFWSPRFGMVADRFGVGWMVSVAP
jgi:uncharacterized glyoxalase superfamily protein PhnB